MKIIYENSVVIYIIKTNKYTYIIYNFKNVKNLEKNILYNTQLMCKSS